MVRDFSILKNINCVFGGKISNYFYKIGKRFKLRRDWSEIVLSLKIYIVILGGKILFL
jgi:hypothetical protein